MEHGGCNSSTLRRAVSSNWLILLVTLFLKVNAQQPLNFGYMTAMSNIGWFLLQDNQLCILEGATILFMKCVAAK